jgi:hypothetical protein
MSQETKMHKALLVLGALVCASALSAQQPVEVMAPTPEALQAPTAIAPLPTPAAAGQPAAEPPMPVGAPAPSAPPPPVTAAPLATTAGVRPARQSSTPEVALREQIAEQRLRAELATAQLQVQTANEALGGTPSGRRGVPQLTGLMSTRHGLVAEFFTGAAVVQVREGEWVTPDWRLTKVEANAVRLVGEGGQRTTQVLGAALPTAASPGAIGAPSMPVR